MASKKKQKVLVTGGLGFIGSHVVVKLINEGHSVAIVDNDKPPKTTIPIPL